MDRSQALNLLKEIARKCPLIDEKTVSLNESNPYTLASKGCQIIVGGINKDDKTCIRKALADYDYLIKELSDRMVIYDPAQLKCPECGRTFDSTKELKTHITASHYSKEYEQTEMPTGRM